MDHFQFRPARPEDEAGVRAISAHIWEGEDYVPQRFHEWLADETGQFTVVYDGDELVAFGKLTELGPGEWWLEGLRVHPDHRGRGLARQLHNYAVALADEIGRGVLRFSTASKTKATHKLAETTGFRLINRRLLAEKEVRADSHVDTTVFTAVKPADLPRLRRRLRESDYFAACHGLMEHHWKLWEILPRLEQLQTDGRLHWWRNRDGFIIFTPEGARGGLNYLDAAERDWPGLLSDAAAFTAIQGIEIVKTRPLAIDATRQALESAGWTIDDEMELWVFERPLNADDVDSAA